jgi:hypothetical protein
MARDWSGQASEHDTDHGEADEGGDGSGVALEVAGETTVAADPGEGAFDDPSFGQDDEAMRLGALDDLQLPGAGPGDDRGHLRPLIAAVGIDDLDEGKQAAGPTQQQIRAVAILHTGRMDHDVQEEAERIDEDMPLAARDLLARVIALRIDRRPPFCAALALWLSITAADGLASRPFFSRTAT